MENTALDFDISPDMLVLGLTGAYFVMRGLSVKDSDRELDAFIAETVGEQLKELSPQSIENDPILEGFRTLHTKAGVPNRKNISASENLLYFLLKHRRLPAINTVVDIYNLISVKSRLAMGAHDAKNITGNIHLRFTNGTEKLFPIDSDGPKKISAGEYAYVDDANDIICRLETRQVEKTKVTVKTKDCFYVVQGNASTDIDYIKKAADDLIAVTKKFCGGEEKFLYAPWLDKWQRSGF